MTRRCSPETSCLLRWRSCKTRTTIPTPQLLHGPARLLSTAQVAQKTQLATDASKKATDQAIQDGDPNAAAKLLVNGTVTPSQMISARKPEFAQKAFTAAAQMQQGWDARKAEADFKVASSPAQVAFFGSAKSLTDPGGTLDQLKAAGDDIPGGKIPVFNSIAGAIKASTGSGPIAKYARWPSASPTTTRKLWAVEREAMPRERKRCSWFPQSKAPSIVKAAAEKAGSMIPSAQRASLGFEQLSAAVGDHPVAVTPDLSKSLLDVVNEKSTGGGNPPAAVKMLETRLTDPSKGPLTYDEARQFASNISRLSARDASLVSNPARMKMLMGNLREALNDTSAISAADFGAQQREHGQFTDTLHQNTARACWWSPASPLFSATKLIAGVRFELTTFGL